MNDLTTGWYVIYVRDIRKVPKIETAFKSNNQVSRIWVPLQRNTDEDYITEAPKFKPIFPGYIFVNISGDPADFDFFAESTDGAFLMAPGESIPAKLTDEEIDRVQNLENNLTGEISEVFESKFKINDKVEITNGPFIDAKGIVLEVKKDKILVEIEIFARIVSAEVHPNACRLLNA